MYEDRSCRLPPSKYPYRFMQFRQYSIAVNEEHGCFLYDDDECWKKCIPESTDVLIYHESWYYRA